MKQVVIVQRRLTHYREPLFALMRERLAGRGIQLRLLCGEAAPSERDKRDGGRLDWAEPLATRYLFGERLCWMNFGAQARGAALVVMPQENKLLYNLLALTVARPRRLAFWGHGRNLQSSAPDGLRERFKRWTSRQVDWWFTYTRLGTALVEGDGVPGGRITTLENAIDASELRRQCEAIGAEQLGELRQSLGLVEGRTALYLGSLYHEKRIDTLLAAGEALARELPGFALLVVGDGPQRALVEQAADRHPWLHYLGPKKGAEKALCLRAADIFLHPGAIGLAIQDAFVAGLALLTTDCGTHGPEIAYLDNGVNGLMVEDSLHEYVYAAANVLRDARLRGRIQQGALQAGQHYTVENMAENFCRGIEQALS